jgi:hypothetical protein
MKPNQYVTIGMVGACAANVGLAFVDAAFGKAKDPLIRFPSPTVIGALLSSSSPAAIHTATTNMVTGARLELPQLLEARGADRPGGPMATGSGISVHQLPKLEA